MHRVSAITLLIFLLSACAPSAPTPVPVSPTPSAVPTATLPPGRTPIPTPVPDILFVDPSLSLGRSAR